MKRTHRFSWLMLTGALTLFPATAEITSVKLVPAGGGINNRYGVACAVDGDTAAVGNAPWFVPGSITVFHRADGAWTEQQAIGPGSGVATAGPSVDVQGTTMVIGGTADATDGAAGPAAHVFVLDGSTWVRQTSLRASDPASVGAFTGPVAIDGDTVVVGDSFNDTTLVDTGAVYVFTRSGTTWSQQAKLVASDAAVDDRFGCDVALSGDTLLVGALGDDDIANASGAAYVFVRSGTTWTEQAKLIPSTTAYYDQVGSTVALDGDVAFVGTAYDDDYGRSSGTVFVYTRSGSSWIETQTIHAPDARQLVFFGSALDIDGDRAIVGALGNDTNGTYAGAAYILSRLDGGLWGDAVKLTSPDALAGEQFGYSAAISGSTIVVGGSGDSVEGGGPGTAWAFQIVPPVRVTDSAFVPTSVEVVFPAAKMAERSRRAPGLYARGILETGSDPVDLTREGDIVVGTRSYALPGLTAGPSGRTFSYSGEVGEATVRYVVTTPKDGDSRATFSLVVEDDLRGVVDPEGELTLGFSGKEVAAEATFDLAGGKFKLTASPATLDADTMLCLGAAAKCLGDGRDSFAGTLRWGGMGEVPADPPEVTLGFGPSFEVALDPAKWKLRGKVWRYSDPKAEGVWQATIDFAKCRATFKARKCTIGAFAAGPAPLRIFLGIGETNRVVEVRARVKGKTLHY